MDIPATNLAVTTNLAVINLDNANPDYVHKKITDLIDNFNREYPGRVRSLFYQEFKSKDNEFFFSVWIYKVSKIFNTTFEGTYDEEFYSKIYKSFSGRSFSLYCRSSFFEYIEDGYIDIVDEVPIPSLKNGKSMLVIDINELIKDYPSTEVINLMDTILRL